MVGRINKIINLAGNMGWRYITFRSQYELMRRTGLLKSRFPSSPAYKQYFTLESWRQQKVQFFFKSKESLNLTLFPDPELKKSFVHIRAGKYLLFNSLLTDLGLDYDWVTNPDSGFHYDIKKHWTEIADYSKEAGDIKFVWEKSRFSYLHDIIRYDYHFNEDCAAMVFGDILSWIECNPINCGPNYRCSQEMSLRVLNWTFALHYYRDSLALTDDVFNKLQYAIYWHMDHVYKNIDFSRIAVRNNHAITETLALYLAGLLFPAFPGADKWKKNGKIWFEQEIAYQVYEDGTFLQFSMNYHRIVVQLLTWGITLSEKNGDRFSAVVYHRAEKSLVFLRTCMVDENGWLPNYGANDGALFFKLNNAHYRDYRPQLQALANAIGLDAGFVSEDIGWYGLKQSGHKQLQIADGAHSFIQGGYYVIREPHTLTFIKCGGYKDRPSHADNLHLDIWYKGENILIDAGSYKYNTDDKTVRYFSGTQSHNTLMLDDKDQMLKGGRFIWYYWTQCAVALLRDEKEIFVFEGAIHAFTYIKDGIEHRRTVVKRNGVPIWEVRDELTGKPDGAVQKVFWHLLPDLSSKVHISARNSAGIDIPLQVQDGMYSSLYGQKENTLEYYCTEVGNIVETTIKVD